MNNPNNQMPTCMQRVTYPDGNISVKQVSIAEAFAHRGEAMALFLKQDIQREKGEPVTDEAEIFNFIRDNVKPRPFSFDEKKDGVTLHYEYI